MRDVFIIYGPRRSGKTTKLIDLARLAPGPKAIVAINNIAQHYMEGHAPDLRQFMKTIYTYRYRGTNIAQTNLFLDEAAFMPPQLLEDILINPWHTITMTVGTTDVQ